MGGLGASPDIYLPTWAAAAVSTYLSGGPPLPGGLPSTSHPFPMAEAGPNSSSPSTPGPSPPPQPGQGGIPFVPLRPEPHLVMRKAISDHFRLFHVAPPSASWPPASPPALHLPHLEMRRGFEQPAGHLGASAGGGSQARFLTQGGVSHSSKTGW